MKFSNQPFIIQDDLSMAIVDSRIPKHMEEELKNKNIQIIKTTKCSNTYDAISYHPDIQVFSLGEGKLVVAPNVYDYYFDLLNKYGFDIVKGENIIEKRYPKNIYYNVVVLGKYAIHNFKYTDKNILKYIDEKQLTKINVSQGYTKCSVCIVDENSIITSDEGIHKECIKYGIESLLISKGEINLFDLDYGFIGGCSGLISLDKIAFFGDISIHPDYELINNFIISRGKSIVTLGQEKLIDLGSIIPLIVRKERRHKHEGNIYNKAK